MMKYAIILLFLFTGLRSFGQDAIQMQTPTNADAEFKAFIKKEKFLADEKIQYAGVKKDELRWELTEKVDKIGEAFRRVAALENPTDIKYQVQIMNGLGSFNDIKKKMTKNDRIRICRYITELMDIVSLASSKGQLNMFAYGFDPSTMKAKIE